MAYKLMLKFNGEVVSEYTLENVETTIGRKSENTIHIDNMAVSSHHARVVLVGNKAIFEDMGSTNGSVINGRQVTKHVLRHGDQIIMGKHELVFVDTSMGELPTQSGAEEDGEGDMEKTMVLTAQGRMNAFGSAEPVTNKPSLPMASVQILSGPQAGKTIDLTGSITSIGKGEGCKIVVKGLTVGKQAAVITRRPTGYHITHLEGLSRTKVNSDSISSEPRILKDGDIITLSDMKMEFFNKLVG
ncbi:MAG: FHA domain-containing protein [Mariprofundaceae bacterium]|nr:FHA domain-containing protein [Mariprofundaceae bacterium]